MKEKIKEPVRLRMKSLANGSRSLYLDIYVDGNRRYEFLKLYLVPEKTRADKALNRDTLALANSVKASRIMDIQAGRFGMTVTHNDKILFFDYFESLRDRKAGTTFQAWDQALKHLRRYEPDRFIPLVRIDGRWVEGFRRYLDREACVFDIDLRKHNCEKSGLGTGTKALYFQKLAACFNQAVKDGIIVSNPMRSVERFHGPESQREFLTLEELRSLAAADCDDAELKRAFLFSCLTGLRWSDITKLRWSEIQKGEDGMRIVFRQQKTRNLEYLDISPQAASFLEENGSGLVFPRLLSTTCTRNMLKTWVARAGLKKHITFHCARHTFAVMMLDLGTDIYTLSKLLGHRDLASTQVYAKILDKNKQAAVARIPEIM